MKRYFRLKEQESVATECIKVEFLHSIIADKQRKESKLEEDNEILNGMPLDGYHLIDYFFI